MSLLAGARLFLQSGVERYAYVCQCNPWSSSFGVCCFKGGLSDIFAQKVVEAKEDLDLKRVLAYATFGGWYCGWAQHVIYNSWYPRFFGSAQSFWPVAKKVSGHSCFTHNRGIKTAFSPDLRRPFRACALCGDTGVLFVAGSAASTSWWRPTL